MPLFVGLDASKHTTAICILNAEGVLVAEGEVGTDPKEIIAFLRGRRERYRRIGIESMSFTPWLYDGLAKAGLPVICIEGVLKARLNKTDRNDARGIAELMRAGIYKAVHIKSAQSQHAKLLITTRKMLLSKSRDTENLIRQALLQYGLKLAAGGLRNTFHRRVDLVLRDANEPLRSVTEALLGARAVLVEKAKLIEGEIVAMARADPVCRRLMTAPGVAALTALIYKSAIDVPERFANSRDVGVHLGLTPRIHQSGPVERRSRISKCGDASARSTLFLAARIILVKVKKRSRLKEWGLEVRARRGFAKASIAVARKLAVALHRMWMTETDFCDAPVA